MPNGIDLIVADHRMVEELFDRFAETGAGFLVGQAMSMLEEHDNVEHGALYPLVGEVLADTAMIERAAKAHSAVKKQIDVMAGLEGEPLMRAFATLRSLVKEHVADEERNILPKLADKATPAQLELLGARILDSKQRVG
jgi:hypothetical protein